MTTSLLSVHLPDKMLYLHNIVCERFVCTCVQRCVQLLKHAVKDIHIIEFELISFVC